MFVQDLLYHFSRARSEMPMRLQVNANPFIITMASQFPLELVYHDFPEKKVA